jgi:serine/threonine protein kinase
MTEVLGHYRILEKLGAGGMGEVFRAADTKLGREVAIKVLPEAFARDPERLARFEREARVLASLNHPNIAAIYGFEQAEGLHFLVLELVPGPNLSGPVEVDEAVRIAIQIAEALEAAHDKGIVHRPPAVRGPVLLVPGLHQPRRRPGRPAFSAAPGRHP